MNPCLPPESNILHANASKLQTLLHEAIQNQNIPLVHKLLSQGASPSAAHGLYALTPLMIAADACSPELIALFLPLNDVDAASSDGLTALHFFISGINYSGNAAILTPDNSLLLDTLRLLATPASRGANDLRNRSPLTAHATRFLAGDATLFNAIAMELLPIAQDSTRRRVIYESCVAALKASSIDGGSQAIFLLNLDADKKSTLLECDSDKESLAHVAALNKRLDFLDHIAPLVDINARDSQGRTPLMASFFNPFSSISSAKWDNAILCMERLIDLGADPLLVDNVGCDALMIAIEQNFRHLSLTPRLARALEQLIARSDLSHRDHLGESALDKALDRGLSALASLIQQQGSSPPAPHPSPASSLCSPCSLVKLQQLLLQAVVFGDAAMVDKRLAQGADPFAHSDQAISRFSLNTVTPLMLAALNDNSSMIRRLLPISDPLAVDNDGNTALMWFLSHEINSDGRLATLAALSSPKSVKIKNNKGQTPLMIFKASQAFSQSVIDLLGPMSDWNALDNSGDHILGRKIDNFTDWLCSWKSHPDQSWLANAKNHNGDSLAHILALHRELEPQLFEAISFHINFDDFNHAARSPLMAACGNASWRDAGFNAVIEFLAPRSDCRLVDLNGCDALMLLIETRAIDAKDDDALCAARLLIPRSNLWARDFLGESALDKARDRNLLSVATAIEAHMAIFAERDDISRSTHAPPCSTQAPHRADRPIQHRI